MSDSDRLGRSWGRPGPPMPSRAALIYQYLCRRGSSPIEEIIEGTGLDLAVASLEIAWLIDHGLVDSTGYEYRVL